MKNSIYIFFISVLLALGIYSCDSSLGYDPNVQITKLIKDTTNKAPDTTNKEVIYSIDSIRFVDFKEMVFFKPEHGPEPPKKILLDWKPTISSKNIKIDTSESDTKLWVNLEVINSEPDNTPKYLDVFERVIGFNLSFSAILNQLKYDLNDESKNTRWFELKVKELHPNVKLENFHGEEINPQLFIVENNKELCYLKIYIESVPDMMNHNLKIDKFSGFIWIYYKKQ